MRRYTILSFPNRKVDLMTKPGVAIAAALSVAAFIVLAQQPAQTRVQPPPTATRDAASLPVNGELATDPNVAMLAGAQGSSLMGFRARPLVGCDQFAFKDIPGAGGYGVAGSNGKSVRVCGYSISNGSVPQDVQFVYGTEASSGGSHVCNPGQAVTARFHLAPNQFISQGGGVGSLFMTPSGQGLCLKVYGTGAVSVNVTYATF